MRHSKWLTTIIKDKKADCGLSLITELTAEAATQ